MKKTILSILSLILSVALSAQNNAKDVRGLFDFADSCASANRFPEALTAYNAAIDIIVNSKEPEWISCLSGDLVDYLILELAKRDKEKAKELAVQILNLSVERMVHSVEKGFIKSKEEYVDNISGIAYDLGYALADAGILDYAEDCFLAGIDIYEKSSVYTEEYLDAKELLGYFYEKYKDDPAKGLSLQYEAYKSAVSLLGRGTEKSMQIFSRVITSYIKGLAFYSSVGNVTDQYESFPIYSYYQVEALVNSWLKIRDDIISSYGVEILEELLKSNSLSTQDMTGEKKVRFGTPEHGCLYKALAAIHYNMIDEYEKYAAAMLGFITDAEDKLAYSSCLIESLRNHNYINYAIKQYDYLIDLFQQTNQKAIAMETAIAEASMMYAYGWYDYAWAKISDVMENVDDEYMREHNHSYVMALALLSAMYDVYKRDVPSSLKTLNIAISIAESYNDSNALSTLYNKLSTLYYSSQDLSSGKEALLKSIDYSRKYSAWINAPSAAYESEKGILWPVAKYSNLSDYYVDSGNYDEANELLDKCISYNDTFYPNSSSLLNLYNRKIYLYEKKGDVDQMVEYSERLLKSMLQVYFLNAYGMTKMQRNDYWNQLNIGYFDIFSEYALNHRQFAALAYNAALISKNFLLKYDSIIKRNVYESADKELILAYEKFKNAEGNGLDTKKCLEDRLMYQYSKHSEFVESASFYGWRDVQSKLRNQDVAIEFATACSDGINTTYVALVVKKGWDEPRVVPLGDSEKFNAILNDGHKAYKNNDYLYTLIWKPLESLLSGVRTIYFAPYGAIYQINIESLMNGKGKRMNKLYSIRRLSSTGAICDDLRTTPLPSAYLYGGLDYNAPTTELLANSRSYTRTDIVSSSSFGLNTDLTRNGWAYLSGTEKEVSEIEQILNSRKKECVLMTKSEGTEESFKSMSGRSPSIIHIATHGYYLNEKEAHRSNRLRFAVNSNDSHSYPLRRCGLILSGGQHSWLGESLPEGLEDGILTGEEIAGMNLSNTDLVVLSACQTGLGEITRDGVYGLHRAFKAAGVRTIVMSLWEVNDEATELMMTKFYSHLSLGKSKRESFDYAVSAVKAKYDDPEYWAAFIMID